MKPRLALETSVTARLETANSQCPPEQAVTFSYFGQTKSCYIVGFQYPREFLAMEEVGKDDGSVT